jgi:hypothetical protein
MTEGDLLLVAAWLAEPHVSMWWLPGMTAEPGTEPMAIYRLPGDSWHAQAVRNATSVLDPR